MVYKRLKCATPIIDLYIILNVCLCSVLAELSRAKRAAEHHG